MATHKHVKPLQRKTMTLRQLQDEALKFMRAVRKQFNRLPYEDGLSDTEFLEQVAEPLEHRIRQDIDILQRKE